MFLNSENYLYQVRQLVGSSQYLDLAIAFWGNGAEKLFDNWHGERLRIVCNLMSGGTNPLVIRQLKNMKHVEVRCLNSLHAKVMLSTSVALIGSANFSTNGLGLEDDESRLWHEAGLFTRDLKLLNDAKAWYEAIWREAKPVSEEALLQAAKNWRKHRGHRPALGELTSLVGQPAAALRDRQVYLAIYWESASPHALQIFAEVLHDLELTDRSMRRDIDFFEDWPDDESNALPTDAYIVCVRYGKNGGVKVENAWMRDPELDKEPLKILRKKHQVASWSFPQQDQALLAKRLKPWLKALKLNDERLFDNGALCIPLFEFLAWEEHNMEQVKGRTTLGDNAS